MGVVVSAEARRSGVTGRSGNRVFFGWKVVATAFTIAMFSWGIGFLRSLCLSASAAFAARLAGFGYLGRDNRALSAQRGDRPSPSRAPEIPRIVALLTAVNQA